MRWLVSFMTTCLQLPPGVRPLFKNDLRQQGRKLIVMLGFIVNGLNSLEVIIPAARSLAIRHVGDGVRREHYKPVGQALIWTLRNVLGEDFTPAMKEAWIATYMAIVREMIAAAYIPDCRPRNRARVRKDALRAGAL